MGGTLFFSADDGTHGRELWKSDGTSAGTVLVKDINPGAGWGDPNHLTEVGGSLFFSVNDGTHGRELWKSDGTSAGTVLVKDINPGVSGKYPFSLTKFGGTIFFTAEDDTHGRELWKSDGTSAGTVLVKDINPGGHGSSPYNLTEVGDTLFFSADGGTHGRELWKSDGTSAGTVRVKDINPGSDSSSPFFLTEVGGTLFFKANDGTHGDEIWKSDGTSAGTVLVNDIRPGKGHSSPENLTEVGGTLFFTAVNRINGRELYGVGPVLFGTSGNDIIRVNVAPGGGFNVHRNGQRHFFPKDKLTIDGDGGTDRIIISGTNGNETLLATPTTFEFKGDGFTLTGCNLEHLKVYGNGGRDKATLLDSPGDDRAFARPGNTTVRNTAGSFSHRVKDFWNVTLRSTGEQTGKYDQARLFDSANTDRFIGSPDFAIIRSLGYRVRTEGYDRNIARSSMGGDDVAILNGSDHGNEVFRARVTHDPTKNFAIFQSGPNASIAFLNRAIGFKRVTGNSKGGDDKVFLFDGKGNDILYADANFAQLRGNGYQFTANQFHRTNTSATNGGTDTATLVDGKARDRLFGTGNVATLIGAGGQFTNSTRGFERVTGNASQGGTDRLDLANDIAFQFFEQGSWEL